MGISNLLQSVKPALVASHISNFKGKRVAVDGYAWIHKATYGCCVELCQGQKTTQWIEYCMSYIDMLTNFQISVILVFDGNDLPAKLGTDNERSDRRKLALAKAKECELRGDMKGARSFYAQAVSVTPLMAAELIHSVRLRYPLVRILVAPYEADAQLAFLSWGLEKCNNGGADWCVDLVISEDSDNIPFHCPQVLYKLERDGSCMHLTHAHLCNQLVEGLDMRGWSFVQVICMCILAGCDYLPSPAKGVGIKTAHKIVSAHKTPANILRHLRLQGLLPLKPVDQQLVPADTASGSNVLEYEWQFYKALATFRHQVIYCPHTRQTKHLTPLPSNPSDDMPGASASGDSNDNNALVYPSFFLPYLLSRGAEFLGAHLEGSIGVGVAEGFLCPVTKEAFSLPPSSIPPRPNPNTSYSSKAPAVFAPPLKRSHSLTQAQSTTPSTSDTAAPVSYYARASHSHGAGLPTPPKSSSSKVNMSTIRGFFTQPPPIAVRSHATPVLPAKKRLPASENSKNQSNIGGISENTEKDDAVDFYFDSLAYKETTSSRNVASPSPTLSTPLSSLHLNSQSSKKKTKASPLLMAWGSKATAPNTSFLRSYPTVPLNFPPALQHVQGEVVDLSQDTAEDDGVSAGGGAGVVGICMQEGLDVYSGIPEDESSSSPSNETSANPSTQGNVFARFALNSPKEPASSGIQAQENVDTMGQRSIGDEKVGRSLDADRGPERPPPFSLLSASSLSSPETLQSSSQPALPAVVLGAEDKKNIFWAYSLSPS